MGIYRTKVQFPRWNSRALSLVKSSWEVPIRGCWPRTESQNSITPCEIFEQILYRKLRHVPIMHVLRSVEMCSYEGSARGFLMSGFWLDSSWPSKICIWMLRNGDDSIVKSCNCTLENIPNLQSKFCNMEWYSLSFSWIKWIRYLRLTAVLRKFANSDCASKRNEWRN